MQLTIPIYQQKVESRLVWTTVGLGPAFFMTRTLTSEVKLKRWLNDAIKKAIGDQPVHALRQAVGSRGVRLKRVRLELSFKGRGRKKVTGLFPIILDPRWRTPDERFVLAYHPSRPHDALVVEGDSIAKQLNPFFTEVWRDVDETTMTALQSDGRDVLKTVSMSIKPRSLLDDLKKRKSPWDDLKIDPDRERTKKRTAKKHGQPPILRRLAVDLTERASSEALDVGRPREPLRSQLSQLICVPRKRPVVLLGPPGVGKRTALRRVVADLLEHEGYTAHRNLDVVTHVYALTGSRLIAGMSYLGQWEQRCVEILESVRGRKVVLWFEDIHTLSRVGRSRDSERSVADFFRGPLDRGEVTIVGSCTPTQWARVEEDAPGFADTFATLRVEPSDRRETLQMMLHEARNLEAERRVRFTPWVFRGVLELGAPLLADQALPGKALDLMRLMARENGAMIDADVLLAALTEKTGLYADLLDPDDELQREDVVKTLESQVMGQPTAVDDVADLILRIRAGVTDPKRPFGTYLFTGPTGTGKTQLAKALASYLFAQHAATEGTDRLIRFDMGELSGPDAVARLIGDRWAPRGLLTEAVKQQPFCVLLLDEIEKAHRSVLHLLLQLLDDGRLTDAAGDRVDFTRCVIVMTSNLGAKARPAVGFGTQDAASVRADVSKAVKEFFPPELFNRIERVVSFSPLDEDTAKAIAEKELAELLGRRGLAERNVFVFAHGSAVQRMADEAFDTRAGARSVKRYLETRIGSLLAEHLAGTTRPEMEIIRLYHAEGEYQLSSDGLREAEPLDAEFSLETLLNQPARSIASHLPAALKKLDAWIDGSALDTLAQRLTDHLASAGDSADDADAVFYLDALRAEVQSFREHIDAFVHAEERRAEHQLEMRAEPERAVRSGEGRGRPRARRLLDPRWNQIPMPRQDKKEMLAALAEVQFLERAIHAEDLEVHEVLIELLRVGQARGNADLHFFSKLSRFYSGWRGECVGAAVRKADGSIASFDGDDVFSKLGERRLDHAVLHLSGVAIREWLAGEEGCHVWNAVTKGSEVVRVRILPATQSPEDVVRGHLDARKAFEEALETGNVPPPDPERLLPVVRRIRFNPPERRTTTAPYEIEDYPTSYVDRGNVADITEVLPTLLWLRMSER